MKKIFRNIFSFITIFSILISFILVPAKAEESIDGHWDGNIAVMGTELKIMIDIDTKKTGVQATIDIPRQGAKALPLKNLKYNTPDISFELESPNGTAFFNGIIKSKNISGDFKQAGILGKFSLEKEAITKLDNSREIEKLPYKQEEVNFKNGEINFAGTLTLPETKGPFPAVIMITGSGPQNRDEELFGFQPFRIIADHLTRKGIAVLRYDDRGIGGSGGKVNEGTTEDFATDVEAATKYLQGRKDIGKIGLIGHSEGGIIAPVVASRNASIAFIVLLAGTSVNGEEILMAQSDLISKANGLSKSEIEENRQLQAKIFTAMKTNKGWDSVKSELNAKISESIMKMPEGQRKEISDIKKYTETLVNNQLAAVQSPWFKYFLTFEPSTVLGKIKIPVLALFGELDLQVPALMNSVPMEKALKKAGNKNYTIKVLPKANHLFQEAKNGSPNEYESLKKEFVPGMLDLISDWILKQVKK